MINPEDVLAVIVSYNGGPRLRQTVEALRGQVGHVHVVDNGSADDSLQVLESLEREGVVSVTRLGENRGVGEALNRGVQKARQLGCPWVLTMDQDTLVEAEFFKAYQEALARDASLVCLTPRIRNGARKRSESGTVGYAITSGNLVRVSLFDEIGPYDQGFFIDCIDFDFCLRLRKAGHSIRFVPGAVVHHQLGEPVRVPGFLGKYYARHVPVRRYYMSRNFMYMVERHLLNFPLFILKLGLAQALLTVLVGFFDPRPLQSYRAILGGIMDYFSRKQGRYMGRTR